MKKIKDLEPSDFPSVNVIKFYEWKKAKMKASSILKIVDVLGSIFIIIPLGLKFGGIGALTGLIVGIIINKIVLNFSNKLGKEIGIIPEAIKAVLKEEVEKVVKTKRPTSITVICIIAFIGVISKVPLIFLPEVKQIGSWYPSYFTLIAVICFVCLIGIWKMRKWAAYTYTGFNVLNQVVLLATGFWNIMALIIPAIVILFVLKNISKMS